MTEIRVFDFSAEEQREYAPHVVPGDDSRSIEGYAIVFNSRSRVLYDKKERKSFVETISPRAITREFLDMQDIKLLFNHDSNHLLGRSMFGAGTLSYEIDDYGVKYRCELPRTADGDMVLELVRRGDLSGCSFAFNYAKDGVSDERKCGENLRTIVKFASISDFSVVVDPAYWGTTVSARAFEEPKEEEVVENKPAKGAFTADLAARYQALQDLV